MKQTIAITLLAVLSACGIDGTKARKNADTFTRTALGATPKKITCQNTDSDGDGYVSCTVRDSEGELYALQCSGAFSFNSGCRLGIR